MVFEDIWEELERMRRRMERLMRALSVEGLRIRPLYDLSETRDEIILTMDMPGVKKEDIEIYADERSIEVRASAKERKLEEGETWIRRERRYAGYHLHITLPCEIDPERVKATYSDGVLEIRAKKARPARKRIQIS